MRIGFVTAMFGDIGFDKVLDIADQENYSSVEVMCWPVGKAERRYAGVTHIDVNELDEKKIEEIKTKLKKKNIGISGLGYYPNPLESEQEQSDFFVSHLKNVIEGAKKLDISIVNTFVGRDHTKDLDYNKEKFKEIWPSIISHAEQAGVKVCIENCPMYFSGDEWPGGKNMAATPAIWRWMFSEIDSPNFGLNYDPSHLIWQFIDYIRPMEEFKEKIFHVHVKDAKIDTTKLDEVGIMATPLEFHTPKLPGLGDINWGAFFSKLTDIRYNGDVVIEVEDRAYEASLETRIGALRQVRSYMRQYLPGE
jgi:sugar phosphate isomerase/epimerase